MRVKFQIWLQIAVLGMAVAFPWFGARAQGGSLQSQLEAQYAITKPTDDKSDIVKAGAVLILEKDKLIMYPTSNQVVPQNTYKDGKLSEGAFGVHHKVQSFGSFIGHPLPDQAQVTPRNFVTGEKFWVTRIDVESDGVTFTLFSDPYNDVRYDSTLKFIFPHGQVPAADQVLKTVAEVLKVDADDATKSDDSGNQQQAAGGDANNQQQAPAAGDAGQQQAAAPAAADAPAAAPPAPPATVEIGQTPDQVTAILGQPEKIINLGAKQIYVYKDLKVTFVKGKVTDAQ
ncbi:MAG: hypothetical protein WA603_04375 [Candidatus Acidiferrales bacterium]